MGLYQQRRPATIVIRDKDDEPGKKGEESPDSADSSDSPDHKTSSASTAASSASPDSALPTKTTLSAPTQTSAAAKTTSASLPPATSSQASVPQPPSPPPPSTLATSTSAPLPIISSSEAKSSAPPPTNKAASSKASWTPAATASQTTPQSSKGTTASDARVTGSSSASNGFFPTVTSALADTPLGSSSMSIQKTETISALLPLDSSVTSQPDNAGPGSGIGEPRRQSSQKAGLGKGAEAALITLSVLGFVAILVGILVIFKRRRRRWQELGMRHAEDAFDPNNGGSLHAPNTQHMSFHPSTELETTHMSQSGMNTTSLFGAAPYARPEAVPTNDADSRIQAPQPTANPFADPGRNKAFDQIRGRPRSTTLTDRGSWVQNPFRDPASDRFDPFGELQAKARQERVKYMEDVRKEQDEQFRVKEAMGLGLGMPNERVREQDVQSREKQAMGSGLDVPNDRARKGSGVTIEGVGVLDRSSGVGYQ